MREIVGEQLLNELEEEKNTKISSYNTKRNLYLKLSNEKLKLLNENIKLTSGKSVLDLENKINRIKKTIKRKKANMIKRFLYKETIVLGIATIIASLSGLLAITVTGTALVSTLVAAFTYRNFKNLIQNNQNDLSSLCNRIRKIKDNESNIDLLTNELTIMHIELDELKEKIQMVTTKLNEVQNDRLIELNNKFQKSGFSSRMKGRYNKEKHIIELYPSQEEKSLTNRPKQLTKRFQKNLEII